jgi:hypothetical protein
VRVIAALLLGSGSGVVSWLFARQPNWGPQDFTAWWIAANALLNHQNPYFVVRRFFTFGFVYPLPTAIATIPLAWIPSHIAGPIFVTISCGILAFVITRTAWWPLFIFLSGSMVESIVMGHWSILLTAAVVAPSLAWLGAFKPNIGLGIVARHASWRAALAIGIILVLSLAFIPTWPRDWIASAKASPGHFAPWRTFPGFLLLLALLRWRRPEARLLAALAVVPSSPIAYEALPLFTVPARRIEMITMVLLSDVMLLYIAARGDTHNVEQYFRVAAPAMVWLLYIPPLIMILRRPNEGALPRWLERIGGAADPSRQTSRDPL